MYAQHLYHGKQLPVNTQTNGLQGKRFSVVAATYKLPSYIHVCAQHKHVLEPGKCFPDKLMGKKTWKKCLNDWKASQEADKNLASFQEAKKPAEMGIAHWTTICVPTVKASNKNIVLLLHQLHASLPSLLDVSFQACIPKGRQFLRYIWYFWYKVAGDQCWS